MNTHGTFYIVTIWHVADRICCDCATNFLRCDGNGSGIGDGVGGWVSRGGAESAVCRGGPRGKFIASVSGGGDGVRLAFFEAYS